MPHGFTQLGGIEKEPDSRDIRLGAMPGDISAIPSTLHNQNAWNMIVEYQRNQPACGAHAGVELKGLALKSRFSPRYTWADIKNFDGIPVEMGTDIRSIFKSLTKFGVLDFGLLGNDSTLPIAQYVKPAITTLMVLNAASHAGMGYGFIEELTFNGLKRFLFSHGPAIVLLRVGKEWWTDVHGVSSWKEKDILPIRPPKEVVSGHFVVAHSYDEEKIYFINHWSVEWGLSGHGYFGPEYMPFVNDAGALFPLTFKKDLSYGMTDPDVLDLQRYLNTHGYPVAMSGTGSAGHETNFFGTLTENAVRRMQFMNGITPVSGYVGPLTRAWMTTHQ